MLRLQPRGAALARAALVAALALVPCPAAAQEPKAGKDWYEDEVDLGFKVRAPRDWEFVPGSPLEVNLIGKYADPGEGKYVPLGKDAEIVAEILLVKFDRRADKVQKETRQIGDKTIEFELKGLKNVGEWMDKALDEGTGWHEAEKPAPLKNSLPGATFSIWEGMSSRRSASNAVPQPVSAFVASFPLAPDLDVAFVGLGPAGKKWRTFESAYAALAKTLQPTAVQALSADAAGNDARSVKRAKLRAQIAKSPGWSLHETPNYFIVSCYDDKQFIEEMKLRLEAIRQVYEKDYPPSTARRIRPAATVAGADGAESKGGGEPEAEEAPAPGQTVAQRAEIDALEAGKNSVVRLCKDADQYHQYGGRQGTGGYFNSIEEELVIYDDKQNRGREQTWSVMNHEGFHQYIHAFFGNVSPHSWYNEGTGDYYGGFEFNTKSKKFTRKIDQGRQDNLLLIRDNYVPLREIVRWTQRQFYGENNGGIKGEQLPGWACYAQGWSMIWFLRTGKGKARGWQDDWDGILGTYLQTLLETSDLDKAVDAAFEGVDWDALETSWRGYMGI